MSEIFSGSKKVWNGLDMVPDWRNRNRRRHPRYQTDFDTVLQVDNVLFKCVLVNISNKGCRVRTEKPIQSVPKEVMIKLIVPRQLDPILLRGEEVPNELYWLLTSSNRDVSKADNDGFGLFSIGERLDYLGGHFEIKSHPSHGTRATLVAPIKDKKEI